MKNTHAFIVDTSHSPFAKLHPVDIQDVDLEDNFWAPRLRKLRENTIPFQYRLCDEMGYIFNFHRAAGKEKGEFRQISTDAVLHRWIEAASFSLASTPDQELHNLVRRIIADVSAAQDEDGYLNTRYTFEKKKERWTDWRSHELFVAGHLIQAAIAYYRATREKSFLETACRFADHIAKVFGPDKRAGTPDHPEIEMALVELYRTTDNRAHLDLAKFFLDKRGIGLAGGDIGHIDHKPFRNLTEIVGHAVCSLYLNCGASDIYMETGEKALWDALTRLWYSMTERKMYVTGGVGSRYQGEAFGDDYELPNSRAYAETCAAIANIMWNWRMLLISGEAQFADMMELTLYNGFLSGISLDGQNYFYYNPLADRGRIRRQRWFGTPCCIVNVARLLASLPGYLYSLTQEGIWVHLYAQGTARLEVGRNSVTVVQRTDYPWSGEIELVVHPKNETTFGLFLRIPGWCRRAEVRVNGEALGAQISPGRYLEIERLWKSGDRVHLSLSMPVERIVSHPHVFENYDSVALKRGPLVYCVEQVDNQGFDVWSLVLPDQAHLKVEWMPGLLNGVMVIRGEALANGSDEFEGFLYRPFSDFSPKLRYVQFTAIPYYAWANREPGSMNVWIRSSRSLPR